jgi:hypothetical protein
MQTGFWRHGLATICKFREERPQRSELSAGSSDRGFGASGQFRWAKRAGPALFLHGRGSNLAGGDLLGTRFLHSSRSIPTKTMESIRPCQISAARSAHDRNGSPFAIPFDVTRFQRSSPLAQTGINGGWRFLPRENEKRATRCSAPVQAGLGLPRGNSRRGQGSQRAFPSRLRQPAGLTAMRPASSFVSTLTCNCPGVVVSRIHMAQPGGSYAVTNPFHPARPQLQRALNQPSTGKTLRPPGHQRSDRGYPRPFSPNTGEMQVRWPGGVPPIFRPNPPISADANLAPWGGGRHDECHRRHPGLHSR